jgi:penicillin-binding protein 1B
LALVWIIWPFWHLSGQFGDRPLAEPTRLYGRATVLAVGDPVSPRAILGQLAEMGYEEVPRATARPGEIAWSNGVLDLFLRRRPTASGWQEAGRLEARVRGGRLASLVWSGSEVDSASLEPSLLASFVDEGRDERRPARLERLPEHLVQAVLAAEDAGFFRHAGLSASGIARAAWVNLRGGEVLQGGSTLTQQLVKNLFLTRERTLTRKAREAVLAWFIDLRYGKPQILTAYLNEIYWGSSGSANLVGVGSAAWAYFGKAPDDLGLCESALLAGMIRSPGNYSPLRHPERARERRDWVLQRMAELDWLEEGELASALECPLDTSPGPVVVKRAPWFADAALAEAKARFELGDPQTSGQTILSTLDWTGQQKAEEAVAWGVEALEEGWEKGRQGTGPLQAALVSLDPRTGGLLAYVGGRDYAVSQFDRVAMAQRQAGSAFKPVIYTSSFESGTAWPSGFVEDAPMTVVLAGQRWSPQNSDGNYTGWVTVRSAVEQSLNLPTVRVALATGLDNIVATARAMGIIHRLQAVPALALGAFEVTPLELATAYATLAAGGVRPPVHSVEAVLDRDGRPLVGRPLPEPVRAVSEESAYLMTAVLQGVLERGTGQSARIQGMTDSLAGKTGTTNDRRDSWFGGYAPNRATMVWVGYDDNSETRLSGTRAGLPIWARFTWAVRPAGGYPTFRQPAGIVTAVIDPQSGELATEACPAVLTEVFRAGQVPQTPCRLHGFWGDWRPRHPDQIEWRQEERLGRWRWLRRVFGRSEDRGPPGP